MMSAAELPLRSCLYRGQVTHKRLIPFLHRLSYRVYALYIDLSERSRLDGGTWWFGNNRRALLSFYDIDHGARDGSDITRWVRDQLLSAGLTSAGHRIQLLCFPRVLGYVFNPLSVFFCFNASETLGAILYEVKNTFGEQHSYLFAIPASDPSPHIHDCDKEFYVSPFIEMHARYHFSVTAPGERFHLLIRQFIEEGELLQAAWNGVRHKWTAKELQNCFWDFPLLTIKIMVGIHWQALKIWGKKARYIGRPPLPERDVSIIAKSLK